jgi:hypothetical protein
VLAKASGGQLGCCHASDEVTRGGIRTLPAARGLRHAAIVVSSAAPFFCPHHGATLRHVRADTTHHTADLEVLISAGRGDVPLVQLRFRCSCCGSARIDLVVMSKDSAVVPW